MKLTKQEIYWIKKNEVTIRRILNKRIDELKDQLLDVPEKRRSVIITFIKEYKAGLGLLTEKGSTKKQEEDFTGV